MAWRREIEMGREKGEGGEIERVESMAEKSIKTRTPKGSG